MLAARALSSHFGRVTVVEKDRLGSGTGPREGVPQGKHIHVLLPGGIAAIERLFPGCIAELAQNGAQPLTTGSRSFTSSALGCQESRPG